LREAVFNVLAHGYDDPVPGARVLDLFAGTGALGIEALSRGAALAVLVDDSSTARGLIRQNLDALGLGGSARVFRRDATRLGPAGQNGLFSLVFCDPPYGRDLGGPALDAAARGGWLAPGALVLLEETRAADPVLPAAFEELERRDYGDTRILFGRLRG
jgi:16S rRNA (guanine966-N2)-methyltransferase